MVKSFFQNIRNKLSNLTKGRKTTREEEVLLPEKEKFQKSGAVSGDTAVSTPPRKRKRKRRKKKKTGFKTGTPAASSDLFIQHKSWDISQFHVPEAEGKTRFHDLNLPGEIIHAVADLGFQYCSPIQAEILPDTLNRRDASGQAQTGTGKTAAFLITVLSHIIRKPIQGKRLYGTPRVLVIAPTRELVIQIAEEARLLSKYFPSKIVTVFGGMDYQNSAVNSRNSQWILLWQPPADSLTIANTRT